MEYIWTNGYIDDLIIAHRKVDDNTLWQVCMVETSFDRDECLELYSIVKERIRTNFRTF